LVQKFRYKCFSSKMVHHPRFSKSPPAS
jgi:hypothetical protein